MKLLCDVCERVVASVICCADEAALCASCDAKVHAANKLASKHQRVPLLPDDDLNQAKPAVCDICQERQPFFFCVEDRALLCRECDDQIHSVNPLAAKHKRYLLTGVRVDNSNAPVPPELAEPANSGGATANSNKKPKLKLHHDAGSNFLAELLLSNGNSFKLDTSNYEANDAEPQLLESSPMLKTLPRLSIQRMLSSGKVPFIAPVLSLLAADHHSQGPATEAQNQFKNVDKSEAENPNNRENPFAHSLSPADNDYHHFNDSSSNITSSEWKIEELLSDFAESVASPSKELPEKLLYGKDDVDVTVSVAVGVMPQSVNRTAAKSDIFLPENPQDGKRAGVSVAGAGVYGTTAMSSFLTPEELQYDNNVAVSVNGAGIHGTVATDDLFMQEELQYDNVAVSVADAGADLSGTAAVNHTAMPEKPQYDNASVSVAGGGDYGIAAMSGAPTPEELREPDDVDSLTEAVVPEMLTNYLYPEVIRTSVKRQAATCPSDVDAFWELGVFPDTVDGVAGDDVSVVPDVVGPEIYCDNDGRDNSCLRIGKTRKRKRHPSSLFW